MAVPATRQAPDMSAADGADEWRDALDNYSTTLDAQRAYLDAVASGDFDVEPPAPFEVPIGLPPSPAAVREMITTLHAATLAVVARHADLPDRLVPPRAGLSISRRTTTTVSVLDRTL
jgi:hypothetical protein